MEFPVGASVTLAELEDDPHPVLARLRAHEPVSWLPALGGWLVTSRELALQVMRDAGTFTVDDPRFTTGQVVGTSMLTLDGEEHARHRDPFARRFRLDAVRAEYARFVETEAKRLVAAFAADGQAELRRALAGPLAATTVARSLGLDVGDVREMLGWYDAMVAAVTQLTAGGSITEDARAAFAALHARVAPELEGTGTLSTDEAVSNAAVLLFGGIETTEGMIANAIRHVLSHPDALAAIRADPSLAAAAVEESLRLEPAAAVVDRYATRDVRIGGADVRRGDLVEVSLAGANRDPGFFPDPDRFDLFRANARHHVAFAHGPHVCVGMHLARLEAQTALRLVLELPDVRLDPARPSAPSGLVFRKPPALYAVWSGIPAAS
ncbi:MAG TPA: cytochrome P450 [Gaiellaceae bacterium]|nr:cytochrome P450 [Gaiellaceae bacterium]